jgi:hypothetical protein
LSPPGRSGQKPALRARPLQKSLLATSLARAALAALLCLAPPARAIPPDARLALEGKKPHIEKLDGSFASIDTSDEQVVRAELLPSGELLLEPRGRGQARVFLFARRLVRVIEVAVDEPLPEPAPAPSGACARPVIDARCYTSWRARLAHLPASQAPALQYELEGLQAEAKAAGELLAQAGLGQVRVSRSAWGVRLSGARDAREKRRALAAVYGAVLGALRFEE